MESGAQLTNAAALMGTPGYMAPEQATGKKVDARADIYALGMTMFELCAGGPAFTADDPIALVVMNMQQPLPDLRQHAPGVPEELVAARRDDGGTRIPTRACSRATRWSRRSRTSRRGCAPARRRSSGAPIAAPAIPATNVHDSRPPAVDAAVAAGAAELPSPDEERGRPKRRSWLAIGVGVGAAWCSWPASASVVMMNKKPPADAGAAAARRRRRRRRRPSRSTTNAEAGDTSRRAARRQLLSTSKPDGPLRVAVLKFKNVGADKELVGLELGIGETAVTAMSAAGGDVTLVERSDIESDIGELDRAKDEHFDKATIAEKGKLEGVQVAVQGGFQRAGKLVRITARFVRVENGEIVDTLTVTRPARDVFGAQDEVARGAARRSWWRWRR